MQTGDKASYVRGFSPEDARALLGSLGFPENGLSEGSSLYRRRTLGTSISEAVSGIADSGASSGEPMTYGYQWRGKAQIGGRTVYLAVDASNGDETDAEGQEIHVTVRAGGKTKKILIGDPNSGFFYREVLNKADEAVLSDSDFIERCTDKAKDCLDRIGLEWKNEWSAPL